MRDVGRKCDRKLMPKLLKPDTTTRRPACVILQALHGRGIGGTVLRVFHDWTITPVKTLVKVTATGWEIEEFARKG